MGSSYGCFLLPIQLSVGESGKAMDGAQVLGVLVTNRRDLVGVPHFWLQPGPALVVLGIWGIKTSKWKISVSVPPLLSVTMTFK